MKTGYVHFGSTLYFPLRAPGLVRGAISREATKALTEAAKETNKPLDARVSVVGTSVKGNKTQADTFTRTFNADGSASTTQLANLALKITIDPSNPHGDPEMAKVFDRIVPVLKKHAHPKYTAHWPQTFTQVVRTNNENAMDAFRRFDKVTFITDAPPSPKPAL